jgi:hypothetical protein
LSQLSFFAKFLHEVKAQSLESKLVLCAGNQRENNTTCSFLIEGYLILLDNATLENITSPLARIVDAFLVFYDPARKLSTGKWLTVVDGWRALSQAKVNGWLMLNDKDVNHDACIDMHECQHYDDPPECAAR